MTKLAHHGLPGATSTDSELQRLTEQGIRNDLGSWFERHVEDNPVLAAISSAKSWTDGRLLGFVKSVGEGVVGIVEGGLMLVRLTSPAYAVLNPRGSAREWQTSDRPPSTPGRTPASSAKPSSTGKTSPKAATANGSETSHQTPPWHSPPAEPEPSPHAASKAQRHSKMLATPQRKVEKPDSAVLAPDPSRAAPEGGRPQPPDSPPRPSWRQSERDVWEQLGPGYSGAGVIPGWS